MDGSTDELKNGDHIVVICSKNHRIVDEPSLEKLKEAPSLPHKKKGDIVYGIYFENEDGKWAGYYTYNSDFEYSPIHCSPCEYHYIWISDTDEVKKRA